MDHFSPVAPAHVRALVLPVGLVERSRFLRFVQRLHAEASCLPLADIEPTAESDAFFLSPSAFPRGSLLYRFSPAAPSEQQLQLSPYELFREPLLVLGVVDGQRGGEEPGAQELNDAVAYLKDRHPRVVHRQLIVLNDGDNEALPDASHAISVSNVEESNDPSLRRAVCEVSARFLLELTTYAKAMHASPSIQTPGQTARSLQRPSSLRESETMPDSGRSTPPHSVTSSTDEGSPARPPPNLRPLPATSFDQMPSANPQPIVHARPESRASNSAGRGKSGPRASSQDRMSVQGFGSTTSQEKIKLRGKARVGIVLGSIYMMAGHWHEALRILVEHTGKLRTLSDHLWHAKGLENMLVCMLLLAWSGLDFQVPSICDPVAERTSTANAARIAAETKAATEGTKQQLQLFRLSIAIPELSKLMLSLSRSTEGSLELPSLQLAESAIRLSKLLAVLYGVNGTLTPAVLKLIVLGTDAYGQFDSLTRKTYNHSVGFGTTRLLSKVVIADMLAQALPTNEDGLATGDHIRILAGASSAYAVLGLDRKKALTVKELVVRLTGALIQARKLGAAEMGIHPAASLSMDTGADTLFAIAEESSGVSDLLADVSRIYGANLVPPSDSETPSYVDSKAFGHPSLKYQLLRELAGFCEASPDPYGVLLLTASLLKASGPNAAIDVTPDTALNAFSRDEQMHLATVISRTVAVSRHLGLTDAHAVYWDPFLVRGVEIAQPSGHKTVVDCAKLRKETLVEQPHPGNPLLYDPNASRPGTVIRQISVLVLNEASECVVTLQNPFDIPIEVDSLHFVSEGVDFSTWHERVTLGPLRFQPMTLSITPKAVGPIKITGCRVKMQGCSTQIFPIVAAAWCAKAPVTVKDLGLDARPANPDTGAQHDLQKIGIEPDIVAATVIDALPSLIIEHTAVLESGLMLLEGEARPLNLVVRNVGDITASIFEVKDTAEVLRLVHTLDTADDDFVVAPGESITCSFEVYGKAGATSTQAQFYYCAGESSAAKYARILSVPIDMTVNAALQVHNLEVSDLESHSSDALLVSFNVRNAWPKSISYECFGGDSSELSDRGVLTPGEVRRLFMTIPPSITPDDYEEDLQVVRAQFLRHLRVLWKIDSRAGAVNLQTLLLSSESLGLLRGSPICIFVDTVEVQGEEDKASVVVGAFVRIRIRLRNRAKKSGPLSVALVPQASADVAAAAREGRRFAVVGTLQRILPSMEEKGETSVDFVLCPLLAGLLELEVVVRPTAATAISRRPLSLAVLPSK